MLHNIKKIIKKTPLAIVYILIKHAFFSKYNSQSNESIIINQLVSKYEVPKLFVEFGFSGWEFNCIKLVSDWDGLLIDGDGYNVTIAKHIFPKKIHSKKMWITLDNLNCVLDFCKEKNLGILSIDVDGNDYWFLEKLIVINPSIIIVEFNVAFGLRPIAVPYDDQFDRSRKHESWEYYGASLSAMWNLCNKHNYSLVEVSKNGINAFFVRNDLLVNGEKRFTASEAYKEKLYPDGSVAASGEFWDMIKHMPYIDVTNAHFHNG
jgi:hypothetical protein